MRLRLLPTLIGLIVIIIISSILFSVFRDRSSEPENDASSLPVIAYFHT